MEVVQSGIKIMLISRLKIHIRALAWIVINDASRENGTMEMIPNSEDWELEYIQSVNSDHHISAINVDESIKENVEVEAGGLVFFNYGILHCTRANTTNHARAGLAYHFLSQDAKHKGSKSKPVIVSGNNCSYGLREYGESY